MKGVNRQLENILLIDDNDTSNFLTEMVIEDLNLAKNITVKLNGKDGLDYLREIYQTKKPSNLPEVILLDLNMPVMDGFEFLEKFYKDPGLSKIASNIIILTTSEYREDINRVNKYPVKGFINKPLTEEKIIEVVKGL